MKWPTYELAPDGVPFEVEHKLEECIRIEVQQRSRWATCSH
jgi:hypothetical protein